MKKKIIITLSALIVVVVVFFTGYCVGQRTAFMTRYGFYLSESYVDDVGRDCFAIKRLNKGEVDEVLHSINIHLNQQIYTLDWIYRHGPRQESRDQAFQRLLDIAEHQSEYKLCPRETKEGEYVHSVLDSVLETASQKKK